MHSLGGGGGNSTNWNAYDVPVMWSMLEDFDTNPQWTHVGGWKKAFELTSTHLAHMRSCRDQLAASWPPEKNEASRVYLAELDELIASVQATYDAAVANHEAMATATGSIATARYKLKPIYDRWQAHATAMADYEAKVARTNSGTPAPMPLPPPLPPSWREDMNAEARAVMNAASSEIALASYRVTTPPIYTAPIPGRDSGADRTVPATDVALVPPVIPQVLPRPAPSYPPSSMPRGPVIAGSLPYREPLPVPFVPGMLTPPSTADAAVPGVIGRVPVATPPSRTTMGVPSAIGPTPQRPVTGGRGPVAAPGGSTTGTVTRPLSRSGVIGATPSVGLGQPTTRPVQRVNPVGGIIGPSTAPGSASAHPVRRGSPASPPGLAGLPSATYRTADGHLVSISDRRGREQRDRSHSEQWDADNPWATKEGVWPVVEPSPWPARHDPGPAIGLGQ